MRSFTLGILTGLVVLLSAGAGRSSDIALVWEATGSDLLFTHSPGYYELSVQVTPDGSGISQISVSIETAGSVSFAGMVTNAGGHQECISPPNPLPGLCLLFGRFLEPLSVGVGPPAPTGSTVRRIEAQTPGSGPIAGSFTLARAIVYVAGGDGGDVTVFFGEGDGVFTNSRSDVTQQTNVFNAVAVFQPPGFNIDFGLQEGPPAKTYSAAAVWDGIWNEAGLGATALTDTTSTPSAATVTVTALSDLGAAGPLPVNDDQLLLFDNIIVDNGGTWQANLSGLDPGDYSLYLYAPSNANVPSGSMMVNGSPVPNLPGDPGGALIHLTSWRQVATSTASGSIAISGSGHSFAGLSGMQVFPVVPEPGGLLVLLPGIALLSHLGHRRLARRGRGAAR